MISRSPTSSHGDTAPRWTSQHATANPDRLDTICWDTDRDLCCGQVHRQQCEDQSSSSAGAGLHKCHQVARRVPRLVGHRVPHKHCERYRVIQ